MTDGDRIGNGVQDFSSGQKKKKKKDKSVLIVKETLEAWVIRGDTDWCVLYEVVGFTEPSYSNLFCPRDRTRSLRSRIGLN